MARHPGVTIHAHKCEESQPSNICTGYWNVSGYTKADIMKNLARNTQKYSMC